MSMLNSNASPIGGDFDVHNLFSDDRTFSKSGNIFCGKPFPRNHQIRFIERVFYSEDFKGANQEELNVMPSKCDLKKAYLNRPYSEFRQILFEYT